jgi:PAS domain S-box-containing protein
LNRSIPRSVIEQAPALIWIAGTDGSWVFANQTWLTFRGTVLERELGMGWVTGIHEDDRQRLLEISRTTATDASSLSFEFRARRADGAVRWLSARSAPWVAPEAPFRGRLVICLDITTERGREAEATAALHRLESLINSAHDMAYRLRLTPTPAVEYIAGAVDTITGRSAEEFRANPALAHTAVHPDDVLHLVTTVAESQRMAPLVTLRWMHQDGTTVWAEHRRRPVHDESGQIVAIEGIARDVTGLVESQRRLQESEHQMRQLAARIQTTREEERTRLARELHDELGQTLTALKLEIGRAIAALSVERLTPDVVDRLQSLMGLSEIGLSIVRRIATDLRPPALDHLGLAEAIRWEALTFKARSGLRCHVRTNKVRTTLTAEQQTAIFRIFQEALTNVVRHAKASAVTVTLHEHDDFELRIRDNGKGITDAQASDGRAIGLIGMRERATLVGGVFQIEGRRGKGTTVSVRVPINRPAPATRRPRARKAERPSR